MREPTANWFFERHRAVSRERHHGENRPWPDRVAPEDGESAPGLIGLPAAVLLRHGARVLDPERAAAIPGWPAPRSTVYRARTLLVPDDVLRDPAIVRGINEVLARVGMSLVPPSQPPPHRDRSPASSRSPAARSPGAGPGADVLPLLPRTAALVPAIPPDGRAARPVVIDAWVALQALRAAVIRQAVDASAQVAPLLDQQVVRRIALEHLLVGSAVTITGSPIGGIGGGLTATGDGSNAGPGVTDSYVYSGDTRTPVSVALGAPRRGPAQECESEYGRRPVVAVLDTGVRAHWWLDVEADPAAGYQILPDGFVAVDHDIQYAICQEGEQVTASGDQSRQVIRHPWDTPVTADPLVGELDTDTGHGTFIAGIVRQVAPDARVLAVRIMHSDGVVNEGDLICALRLLVDRIVTGEDDPAAMVDVVSLSLGYFDESPRRGCRRQLRGGAGDRGPARPGSRRRRGSRQLCYRASGSTPRRSPKRCRRIRCP